MFIQEISSSTNPFAPVFSPSVSLADPEEEAPTGWVDERYDADPEPYADPFEIEEARTSMPSVQLGMRPSAFVRMAFKMPRDDGTYESFSFNGRRHMERLYDTPARRVLLCCSRQSEKCQSIHAPTLMSDGRLVPCGDIRVGDELVCMDSAHPDRRLTTGKVAWVSDRFMRPAVRVVTRQGHELELGEDHPVRTASGWVRAADLLPEMRLAAVRRAGGFGQLKMCSERIELTAFLLGDGALRSQNHVGFCKERGAATRRVSELYDCLGAHWWISPKKESPMSDDVRTQSPQVIGWLREDGLWGKYSYERVIPDWVFSLGRADTALFLNRLWATDGSLLVPKPAQYGFTYCSTSRQMCRQVQSLLWKFGVPSTISEFQPTYVCTNGEKARLAWVLRIEGQEGIRTFLTEIGALGKDEGIPLPTAEENSNRDTLPFEFHGEIREIYETWSGLSRAPSWRSVGLLQKPAYPISRPKLRRYIEFLSGPEFELGRAEQFGELLFGDIYWDEVVSVEPLGEIECVDFSVEKHENFIVDGVVTHNSTLLGNIAISYSCLIPAFRFLYISPSTLQTKTFSADRIKEPLDTSSVLRAFTTNALVQNVFEKQFLNRSKITLRYAFLTADRARGIPAWQLGMDEIQDIIADNIPVIEQCLSHAPKRWKRYIYAGTPKTLENTLEHYRSKSTQGEWVVPCDRCGSNAKGAGGRFWNILGEKNIGKTGPICARCGERIFPAHEDAQWGHQSAITTATPWESYRINQLMVPWLSWVEDILYGYEHWPRARFFNEVLGLAYDSGTRPITMAQLISACNAGVSMQPKDLRKFWAHARANPVFMGIDWGGDGHSYTVITLATYWQGKYQVFYAHRCTGELYDPENQLAFIRGLVSRFNVTVIGADYGGGQYGNTMLYKKYGAKRLVRFQYVLKAKKKILWNRELLRFMVMRTEAMTDLFTAIKRGEIRLPRWEDFHASGHAPFVTDILNIYSQYNNTTYRLQYNHPVDKPDDTFHSILYGFLASQLIRPRPDLLLPLQENQGVLEGVFGYEGPIEQWVG